MTVAQVVPLRRFDQPHWWFDYTIPADWSVQVGQLVTIPFQRRILRGVVWSLSDSSLIKNLRPLNSILSPEPVMTPWQQRLAQTIAEQSCSSLGHVLNAIIPELPKRQVKLRRPLLDFRVPVPDQNDDLSAITWYRSRPDTLQRLANWLGLAQQRPRVIIVPTIADGEDLVAAIRVQSGDGFVVSSKLTPAQFRELYQNVRSGKMKQLIVTGLGMLLPFNLEPEIILDQAEHPGHKLLDQQPRFHPGQILAACQVPHLITTPAPPVWLFHQTHPAPPPAPGPRKVWSLGDPSLSPWLSAPAIELIESASPEHPVLLIAPQRGFANLMTCRSCGYVRSCPWCGATVQFFAPQGQLELCRVCQRQVQDAGICPRCQGTDWKFSGLGVERALEIVKTHTQQPSVSLTSAADQSAAVIGSYTDIRQLNQPRDWQATIVLAADSLLHWPDFSVHERAWQFLQRLHAWRPAGLAAVQTYHPDQDFWQAWQHGRDHDWYRQEIQNRMRLGLPPFREHWVVRRSVGRSGPSLRSVLAWFQQHPQPGVTIELHATAAHLGRQVERLVLSGPGQPPLKQLLPWQELFPYPWQVDTQPQSWLL